MRFLRRQLPFADAPQPDVIVLDLNLPLKNGKEVLKEMMGEPASRTIPVAILSTSNSESDIARPIRANVACISSKPLNSSSFKTSSDRLPRMPSRMHGNR